MKIVLVLSALVAFASADTTYEAAYIPFPTNISSDPVLRIVGGQNAARNQFPYQVSIQRRGSISFSHICGGSIISPSWILTAAHCTPTTVANSNYRVVAGILLLTDSNVAGQQTRNVARIINHPSYPGNNQVAPNDISVVQLATALQYAVNVQPISIPPQGHVSRGDALLSGWGLTRPGGSTPTHLQFADLPVVPEAECNSILNSLLGASRNPFSTSLNLCSGPRRVGQSVCSGDSGGPLAKNGRIIGIVSWALMPCGEANAPSIYVKTSAYTNWITSHTNVRPL